MAAAYASIPNSSIARHEEKDGNPIEITFSIQKYKIPPTDPELKFLNDNKAKFPIFDTKDTNNGVSTYLNNLSKNDDVGFILKFEDPFSKSYARATKKPMHVVDHVQRQLPHTSVVDRVQPQLPPRRSHLEHIDYTAVEAILEARKNASSPFRPRRKKLSKSGKKVGKKSNKKSGKVRKDKRKTRL